VEELILKYLGKAVDVIIDRPKGSAHPDYPDIVYPLNYGYIKDILAPDGEAQDVYVLGVDEPLVNFTGEVIAAIRRENDVEDKWIVAPPGACYLDEEIAEAVHFQERFFDSHVYSRYVLKQTEDEPKRAAPGAFLATDEA